MRKHFALCFALLIFIFSLSACKSTDKKGDTVTRQGFFFDTVVNITVEENDLDAVQDAFTLCSKMENIFSRTTEDSELYKINSGQVTDLSEDMEKVIDFSILVCELSGGAFDITVAPLVDLWDVKNRLEPPSDDEINSVLSRTDYKKISLEPFDTGGTKIDLGSTAKGYAADCIVSLFRKKGVERAIIDLGGNCALIGEFSVGIRNPFNPDELYAKIMLRDKSAVTSGSYQRYFDHNGTRYHHIIDPRNGYCASSGIASVTVISPVSMQADALSTAIFVMGEEGIKLCDEFEDTDALIILENGEIITTEGFDKKYSLELLND